MKQQYNFEGNYDLVKFIKLVQSEGMYVVLRLGPFVQGEWNYGYGFCVIHGRLALDSNCSRLILIQRAALLAQGDSRHHLSNRQ